MGKFTTRHDINCNTDTYWNLVLNQEFLNELFIAELACPSFSVLEQQVTDTTILHKWRVQPNWSWSGPLTKLVGSGFTLIMEGNVALANNTWQIKYTPSTLADKLRLERNLRIVANDNPITQYSDYIIEAKIFGVGGLLESTLEKQLRTEADQTSAFINKYLKNHT